MGFDPRSIEHLNIFFPGNLELKIRNELEWTKARKAVGNIPKAIRRGYEDAVEKFASKLIRTIKNLMVNGDPSWAPLSQSTLQHYKKKYPSATHPWYRSGTMHDCIDLYEEEHGHRVYVGLSQYNYYEPQDWGEETRNGLTMVQLAKLLEFGGYGGRIPARPLFSTALEKAGGQKEIRRYLLDHLRKRIKELGFTGVYVRF